MYIWIHKLIHILPKISSINKNSWQESRGGASRNYRKPVGTKQDDTNYDEVQMSLSEVIINGVYTKNLLFYIIFFYCSIQRFTYWAFNLEYSIMMIFAFFCLFSCSRIRGKGFPLNTLFWSDFGFLNFALQFFIFFSDHSCQ